MTTRETEREALLHLVDELYSGLLLDMPWRDFLRSLARYMGSSYATLILTCPGKDQPGEVLIPDVSASAADNYATNIFRVDPFVGLPEGRIVDYSDFVATKEQSDEWHRFFGWSGANHILGLDLRSANGIEARFRVTRNLNKPEFTRSDRAKFDMLVPLLRTALAIHERLRVSAIEQAVYCGAIESFAIGMIILDHTGRILQCNSIASRLIDKRDGIISHAGKVRLGTAAAQQVLDNVLNGDQAIKSARIQVWQPRAEQNLNLIVNTISAGGKIRNHIPSFVLFVSDPDHHKQLDPDALRDIFQMTRMEALIASELAGGSSLVEAAKALGIAHSTARTHLRSIFVKTGAQRQSQLLNLIQSSLVELSGMPV